MYREELEVIANSIPDFFCLHVAKVENYDPEKTEKNRTMMEKSPSKKRGKGNRPETAPAKARGKVDSDFGQSAFDPYYIRASTLQKDLNDQENLEVRDGVSFTQQSPDRPSTATTRKGNPWP